MKQMRMFKVISKRKDVWIALTLFGKKRVLCEIPVDADTCNLQLGKTYCREIRDEKWLKHDLGTAMFFKVLPRG